MIITDTLLLLSLVTFLIVWWMPKLTIRSKLLWLSAAVALLAGLAGANDYRWQNSVGAAIAGFLLLCLLIGSLRNKPRTKLPWVSGIFIALLVAVAALPIYLFPVVDMPEPSGEHPVGTRAFELADESRTGLLGVNADEPRRLLVRAWYPATDVSGIEPRVYLTDMETDHTVTGVGDMLKLPFLFQYFKHAQSNSYPDAPLLTNAKKLPTVIYSHGFGSFAGQNTALMEELASHGYMVYSVQHTGNSAGTIFPNGDVIGPDPALVAERNNPAPAEVSDAAKKAFAGKNLDERHEGLIQSIKEAHDSGQYLFSSSPAIWLDDRLFVMDQLQQGSVPSHVADLAAASNLSRTGQVGMSFGGSTSGGVCMVDSRCAAAVNLDGSDFHGTPLQKNIPVPFLMLYGDFKSGPTLDEEAMRRGQNDFSYERPELAELRDDVYRFMVKGATHFGFSDFSLLMRDPAKSVVTGSIDGPTMVQIQNDLVLGFLDTYLRGKDVSFPQSQQQKHADWVKHNDISDVREWWLAKHPQDKTERVVLETDLGEIEVALYPERAPIAVAQFLNYVTGGHFDGATLYDATSRKQGGRFDVVLGGLLAGALRDVSNAEELAARFNAAQLPFGAIAHETSEQTGIPNERGTLTMGRAEVGSANSEFFFNVQDNPGFDSGENSLSGDGQGYTAFGRVIRGLPIIEQMQQQLAKPRSDSANSNPEQQKPITIVRAYKR